MKRHVRSDDNRRGRTWRFEVTKAGRAYEVQVRIDVSCQEIGSTDAVAEVFEDMRKRIET